MRIEDFQLGIILGVVSGSKIVNSKAAFDKTPKDLPIYIFSGDKDPVGEMGKGVKRVVKAYKNAGIKDLTFKLYEDGRHEMLNELNRQEVLQDITNWLNQKI